jgi:hypothetical protein
MMAFQDMDNGSTQDQLPVACSLDAAQFRSQSDRWERLLADAAVQRVETGDGLRVRFRADAKTVDELQQLVAVENGCCAWASWTVAPGEGCAEVVVSSTGDGIAALHAMLRLPA